ncbi:helix-turn-helix domain-containing protein [Alkalimonas collagenimarina]|uniref:Helix-turn-helix domain-containing protein n=1 Tax=Alkalimonas collagenimarina TaxID=400390 RepID=A0ABT9GW78_9GAMM|nr:helix-turn-helix domain-containing protein [Alkalimonas collagenimarina]MDP4535309.1 helix-turn-helix domain-containing protein [Alkalimonas collagenimarina]
MLDVQAMKSLSQQITQVMPWVQGISSDQQYDELLALMDELVEDYDANQVLIELLFPVLQEYEETAERFKAFNHRIEELDPGIAMLRLLIDQHGLTQSDFQQEIGGKSLVSQILSGKRSLTLGHIRALSKRFGVPAAMFV